MKRRIIKQGHNTLTLTIPSEWAKRFNLAAGSEIDVSERENGLFISTEKNGVHKKIEFSIDNMDIPMIWKYFMAVYREGYDEVVVRFNPDIKTEHPFKFFTQHKLDLRYKRASEKKPIAEVLQGFVNRFIGFEIVEHGKDYIIVKEMGEVTSREFDNSLRRVFLLIQQMAEEIVEAVKKSDASILVHTHDVDINLDKFHDYCIRILNKIGNKEPRKSELLFAILFLLELMGDEYKNIAHHLLHDFPKAKLKSILHIAESIKDQIDLFYDLFYKFDIEKVKQINEKDQQRYFSVGEMYKKTKDEEVKEIFHHLRVITRYINALTELRIEMEF